MVIIVCSENNWLFPLLFSIEFHSLCERTLWPPTDYQSEAMYFDLGFTACEQWQCPFSSSLHEGQLSLSRTIGNSDRCAEEGSSCLWPGLSLPIVFICITKNIWIWKKEAGHSICLAQYRTRVCSIGFSISVAKKISFLSEEIQFSVTF